MAWQWNSSTRNRARDHYLIKSPERKAKNQSIPFKPVSLLARVFGRLWGPVSLFLRCLEECLCGANPLTDGLLAMLCGLRGRGVRPAILLRGSLSIGRGVVRDLGRRSTLNRHISLSKGGSKNSDEQKRDAPCIRIISEVLSVCELRFKIPENDTKTD